MADLEDYDPKLLDLILYDGHPHVESYEFPVLPKYKMKFTPDPIDTPSEDPEKLEKLIQGKHLASKKIQEIYDPLDLVYSKELQDMSYTEKTLKTYLNDKRQYQTSKLPTVHTQNLRDLALQLSSPTVIKITPLIILIGN